VGRVWRSRRRAGRVATRNTARGGHVAADMRWRGAGGQGIVWEALRAPRGRVQRRWRAGWRRVVGKCVGCGVPKAVYATRRAREGGARRGQRSCRAAWGSVIGAGAACCARGGGRVSGARVPCLILSFLENWDETNRSRFTTLFRVLASILQDGKVGIRVGIGLHGKSPPRARTVDCLPG